MRIHPTHLVCLRHWCGTIFWLLIVPHLNSRLQKTSYCENSELKAHYGHLRSYRVVKTGTSRKHVGLCDFLLMVTSNKSPISRHFGDFSTQMSEICVFFAIIVSFEGLAWTDPLGTAIFGIKLESLGYATVNLCWPQKICQLNKIESTSKFILWASPSQSLSDSRLCVLLSPSFLSSPVLPSITPSLFYARLKTYPFHSSSQCRLTVPPGLLLHILTRDIDIANLSVRPSVCPLRSGTRWKRLNMS